MSQSCYCFSGRNYEICCKPFIEQGKSAPTAQLLMRSRYSAYVLTNSEYLKRSWHKDTVPDELDLESEMPDQWTGLEIVAAERGGADDTEGEVEFIASFTVNGKAGQLHERSFFVKENEIWYYRDGEPVTQETKKKTKIGRNAPCPCGSGKKYKKCCGP